MDVIGCCILLVISVKKVKYYTNCDKDSILFVQCMFPVVDWQSLGNKSKLFTLNWMMIHI